MHENRLPDIHVLPHIWNEMYIAGEKMYQHTKHHDLLHDNGTLKITKMDRLKITNYGEFINDY